MVVTGTTTASGLTVAPASGVTVLIEDDEEDPVATLVLTPASISENGGESTVSAILDRPTTGVTTVTVSATPVDPAEASDFTLSGSVLTIASGQTTSTGTVTVRTVNNDVAAQAKQVTVSGTAENDLGVDGPADRTLRITDDDSPSTGVTLTVSPNRVMEGGGASTVTVTATLDGAARPESTDLQVRVTGGTAVQGTDFSAVPGFTVTIDARARSGRATFDLVPLDNNVVEPDRTVVVRGLSGVSGLTVGPAAGVELTIVDDDATPSAPRNLIAEASDGQVRLQWTAPASNGGSEITGYEYQQKAGTGSFGAWSGIAGAAGGTTEHTVIGLTNGTAYTFKVRAKNSMGEGPASNQASATPATVPTAPRNFTAAAGDGEVTLEWSAPASDGDSPLLRYEYRVSVGGVNHWNPNWTAIPGANANTTEHTVRNLTNGTAYTFELRGATAAGKGVAASQTATPLPVAPSAPRSLTGVSRNQAVKLMWRAPIYDGGSAILGYQYRQKVGSQAYGNWTDIPDSAPVETNALSYTVTGLTNNVHYRFKVRAVNAAGEGTVSDEALGIPKPVTTPGGPRAPQISSGNSSVTVQWLPPLQDGGTPVLHYEYCLEPIFRCEGQWVEIPLSAPGGANHGRYTITRDNGAYTIVYLRAVNAQGAGPHVNLQAVARAGGPDAPTNLRGEALSAEYVKIAWSELTAPAGVTITGYDLERSRDGVTWAGGGWEPRGTNSVTVRIGPNTTLYYRIRTIFRTNTPTLVSGMDLSRGTSPASPIVEITTVRAHGTLALPTLAVTDGYGHEGTNAAIVFDVWLTGAQRRTSPVTMVYRTQDLTAHAGSDYTARTGTLSFAPGETEKTVSVPLIDDTVEDSGEEFVLRLSNVSGAHLSRAGGFGTIYNSEDILSGFTLVNAASGTDAGALEHGATVTLDDPGNGQYGVRVEAVPDTGVNSVRLELSGAKTVSRTDNEAPFTLYAEGGEALPPGIYTLQATAYPQTDRGGNALQTVSISFTIEVASDDVDEETTTLSAMFPQSPFASTLHKGASDRPQVVVTFSEAVSTIAASTPSVQVTGGSVALAQAHTEDGLENAWIFFLTPEGNGDMTFTLSAGAACDSGGICTAAGTTLTEVPAARTLPGPGSDDDDDDGTASTGLTASFSAMPSEHAGPSETFTFELAFSESPSLSYQKLRDDAFTVSGGTIREAQRLQRPSNIRWRITVEPAGWGDVSLTLPGGKVCTATGAICTGDNRMLSNSPSATVQGPTTLSVADANAHENTDTALDFTVSLNRTSTVTVTVDYATSNGTATAGEDYTSTSGMLTFTPGETAKTVSVPVLDDAHNDGEETLTLTLSNAVGARIRDAEATGTIVNSDPIPQAWLARFGRTVADHVVDAIGERLKGSPGGGSQVTLGGQPIPLEGTGNGSSTGGAAGSDTRADAAAADTLAAFAERMSNDGNGTAWVNWGRPGGEDAWKRPVSRTLSGSELLLGSSFVLGFGGDGAEGTGTAWTAWGRAASSSFDGNADGLSVDGEVTTFTLGADAARGRWLGGVALAHSTGEGGFRDHADTDDGWGSGTLESTLTSVHPYLRFRASERLSLWGVLGYGTGDLTLELDAVGTQPRRTWKTDTGMGMAAAGARGVLLSAADHDGFELPARGDARLVGMRSDAATGADGAGPLAATESQTSRVRFALEGSRGIVLEGGQTLRPTLEVGLRHDGGDAEIGTGIEVGAGVSYADPELGLTVEGKARGLVAHKATDYREWGASGVGAHRPGCGGARSVTDADPCLGGGLGRRRAAVVGARCAGSRRERRLRAGRASRRRGGLRAQGLRRARADDAVRGAVAVGRGEPHLAQRRSLDARAGRGVRRRGRLARGRQRQRGRTRDRVQADRAFLSVGPRYDAGRRRMRGAGG